MKYVVAVAIALAPLAACATGNASDPVDAHVIDGAGTAIDGAVADAAEIDGAVAPIDAALPIDAATDAAPPIDAAIDSMPGGPVDTCAQGLDITAGALTASGIVVTGDLTGYANDIQPASSCTGFTNDGPDAVYVLNLTGTGRVITASVTATWDAAIEIVQPCALTPTCLAGQDNGDPEAVTFTTTAAGTYHIIVDSWDAASFGAYTLTVRVQ